MQQIPRVPVVAAPSLTIRRCRARFGLRHRLLTSDSSLPRQEGTIGRLRRPAVGTDGWQPTERALNNLVNGLG